MNKGNLKILAILVTGAALFITYLFFQLKAKPAMEKKAQQPTTMSRTFTVEEADPTGEVEQ